MLHQVNSKHARTLRTPNIARTAALPALRVRHTGKRWDDTNTGISSAAREARGQPLGADYQVNFLVDFCENFFARATPSRAALAFIHPVLVSLLRSHGASPFPYTMANQV